MAAPYLSNKYHFYLHTLLQYKKRTHLRPLLHARFTFVLPTLLWKAYSHVLS